MEPYIIGVVSPTSSLKTLLSPLKGRDFVFRFFETATLFSQNLDHEVPDIVVLDHELGEAKTQALVKKIRASSMKIRDMTVVVVGMDVPIFERCVMYQSGADLFVSLPFSPDEFSAMIRAKARQIYKKRAVVRWGPYVLDKIEREARCNEELVNLTNCEFLIFQALMEAQGKTVTREEIYKAFGDPRKAYNPKSKALDMHIKSLREKLGAKGDSIESVYGGGYRMAQ